MKRLIINADDLGYDPAVSRGILESIERGIVTSATFMVNTPFSETALSTVGAPEDLALGLHLNLARHAPLWKDFPASLLTDGMLSEARISELPAAVVANEARAQLDRMDELTLSFTTHIDVHKHLHLHPEVLMGVAIAAKERDLPVRSINPRMRKALRDLGVKTTPHLIGDAGATAYWTLETLERELRALADGVTELMCHPGHRPEKTRSGYVEQREVELQTFTHPRARELINELGIELACFADVELAL